MVIDLVIAASVLSFTFLLCMEGGPRIIILSAATLLCVTVPVSAADMEGGWENQRVESDYRMKKEAPGSAEEWLPEQTGSEKYFPLYGSREERIFKPWLEVFSYRGERGFRLNVDYERETQEEGR